MKALLKSLKAKTKGRTMCLDEFGRERKCSILLVEDSIDSLEIARLHLELIGGFKVCTAIDAGSVLDTIEDRCKNKISCFDLVILDIDLPDVRGDTLARWIRKIYPDMPIILYTAYGRLPAFVAAEEELGAKLITKPVEPSELIAWCRTMIFNPVQSPTLALDVPDSMVKHIQEFRRSLPHRETC